MKKGARSRQICAESSKILLETGEDSARFTKLSSADGSILFMEKTQPIHAVVFDVDGTLFDTLPSLAAAINEVLLQAGMKAVPRMQLQPALGEGLRSIFRGALAVQTEPVEASLAKFLEERFLAYYTRYWLRSARLFDRVLTTLTMLRAHGLRLGICTNRDRISTETLLKSAAIANFFDTVVGFGEVSAPKPAPDALLHAIRLMKLTPSHALFVGGSALNAQCAHASGVRFAAYRNGFRKHPDDLMHHSLNFQTYDQLYRWIVERLPNNETPTWA